MRSLAVLFALSLGTVLSMPGPVRGADRLDDAESPLNLAEPIVFASPEEPPAPVGQQQRQGYYTPVQPQPYQRKCGTMATDVCPSDVSVPAGATGEQLYTMALQADQAGRKSDAEGYLIKSAAMGYVRAEAAVGIQYADGRGMPHDDAKAIEYLNAAARQGSAGAEAKLGDMYDKGQGVARDPAAALRYYQAAAQQHNSSAEFNLGLKYEFGDGVAHNRATAVQYLRRAGVDGHEGSMTQLADALAKAPASKEFHSVDDISAYLHPAVHMKAGACGPVPTLSPILNGYGFSQVTVYCKSHLGCPYKNQYVQDLQYCYSPP